MLKLLALTYLIICLIYCALRYHKNKQDTGVRMIILLFFPLLGLVYLLILDFFHYRSQEKTDYLELESEILRHSEELNQLYLKVDVEKEINIVPMEEALLLNDTGTRRKMLINVLKEDSLSHIGVLETALQNSDTETAHYAATAVVELKRKLQLELQELSVKFEENKSDVEVIKAYANVLKRYMATGFLDKRTHKKYQFTYSLVLEQLIGSHQAEENDLIEAINVCLDNQEYPKAASYCQLFHSSYPKSEQPFVMSLKLFYCMRSYNEFQAELVRMKQSPIRFTPETLKLIRFWNGMLPKSGATERNPGALERIRSEAEAAAAQATAEGE